MDFGGGDEIRFERMGFAGVVTHVANLAMGGLAFDLRYSSVRRRPVLLRKEVIQPQVPLRLPCYDFTPVADHSLGTYLPCGLAQPLLEQSTPMV